VRAIGGDGREAFCRQARSLTDRRASLKSMPTPMTSSKSRPGILAASPGAIPRLGND